MLVTDDDAATRLLLTACIEGMGLEVHLACNGQEAVLTALEKCPDVVLLDMDMPVMGGLDALKTLKARRETAKIPVLMVTARSKLDIVELCLSAGAAGYLIKPLDLDRVRAKLAGLLPAP